MPVPTLCCSSGVFLRYGPYLFDLGLGFYRLSVLRDSDKPHLGIGVWGVNPRKPEHIMGCEDISDECEWLALFCLSVSPCFSVFSGSVYLGLCRFAVQGFSGSCLCWALSAGGQN